MQNYISVRCVNSIIHSCRSVFRPCDATPLNAQDLISTGLLVFYHSDVQAECSVFKTVRRHTVEQRVFIRGIDSACVRYEEFQQYCLVFIFLQCLKLIIWLINSKPQAMC